MEKIDFFYRIIVFRDDETGGYVSVVPSLPGCVSQGETVSEAIEMIKEAASLSIEYNEEKKLPIPPPDFTDNCKLEDRLTVILHPGDVKHFWKEYMKKGEKN